jgi:hypothetical protein
MIRGVSRGLIRMGIVSLLTGMVLKLIRSRYKSRSILVSEAAINTETGTEFSQEPAAGSAAPGVTVITHPSRFSRLRAKAMATTWSRILTGAIVAMVAIGLYSALVATDTIPPISSWFQGKVAQAGILGKPNQSFPITPTLIVSVPSAGSFATDAVDSVIWFPFTEQSQFVKVFKSTFKQDNFVSDATEKLTKAGASHIQEGKAGVWSYVGGRKDGMYSFIAFCDPIHAEGQAANERVAIEELQKVIVSRHAGNNNSGSTTEPTGSWGRSSGSSGSNGWSGSFGS